MANIGTKKGVIGILTGGGDVPGLNPAIRAVTIRALGEGYQVIGLRRGWASLVDMVRDKDYDNSDNFQTLSEELVNRAGRSGGTFLHTSRTNPSRIRKSNVPLHLQDAYNEERNDLTPEVLKNLEWLGIKYLIPIGGDDTLSYAVRMSQEGVKVIAIPKTMDNDVPGTDYCIGFSTCVTRIIEMTNRLRTSAGSHERLLVMEVFGRYAGFTAILPTMAGAAHRCVIPEYKFNIELLTELLMLDRRRNPSRYSVVLISEGAMFEGGDMVFEHDAADAYGHKKLGGSGRPCVPQAEGAFSQIQQRQDRGRHEPEAGLPGAMRRSRRHRLHRAHGIRQSGARSSAQRYARKTGGAEGWPLRQCAY